MKRILKFLNLLDRENNLSLTNLSMLIMLIKVAVSPFDYAGAAILLPILGSYMQKRYESNKANKESKKALEQENVQAELDSIKEQLATHKELSETITKQSEELKKIISTSNLTNAFAPKRN